MNFSFQNISIRYKITLLVMIACTITLAAGFTIALRNDVNLLRKDFEDLTSTKAKLIGEYAISSLINHDKDGCKKILKTGASTMDYISVEIYDENGDLFSKIGEAEEKIPSHIRLTIDSAIYVENLHEIKFSHIIQHENYVFGYIILHTTTTVLENEISRDIKALIGAAFVIILIGGVLVFYAQRALSAPIYRLTRYLDYVAKNSNISKSIPIKRKDEIGSIYVAINKLLKTIQKSSEERDIFFSTIQKNNEKLGRTLDAFSDGHWEFNVISNKWYFSDAWLNTFGYTRNGFDFGNSFWEKLIHPDDLTTYQKSLDNHFKGISEYFDVEFRILGKKGGYRWVQFKGHWVEKENEMVTDMLGITIDIQEIKNKEALVLAANKRKINDSKLEALGDMVSGISHSIKNYLNPVYGYADFGLMTINDNTLLTKELVAIKHSAKKANDVVEDILVFAGVINLDRQRIDLISILESIIENLKISNPKELSFKLSTNLNKASVLGDTIRIKQCLEHIIQNSIDASQEKDTIEIEINYTAVEEKSVEFSYNIAFGEYVSIVINDQGNGIEEENLDRIFDPFYTTKNIGEAIGLGLSVAKGIISAHKGYIFIESKTYEGTKVQILLPTI